MTAPAGQLDTYVEMMRSHDGAANAFNEPQGSLVLLEPAWAARIDISDREKMAAGDQPETRQARFRMRRTPVLDGLTASDVLRLDGVDWNIVSVKQQGATRDAMLEIRAEIRSDE